MLNDRDSMFNCGGFFLLALLLLIAVGCSEQKANDSREQVRKGAADATAEVKKDATAIAQGVKEGWNRDKKSALNLNSASKAQLLNLPGITKAKADEIVKGRPYSDKHELVTRGILSENEYDRIADAITVN